MIRSWVPIWVVPLILVLAVLTVSLRLWVVRTSYEVNQTEKMIRNANHQLEQTQLKVAQLRSPARLKELARGQLGLEPPAPEHIVKMKETGVRP